MFRKKNLLTFSYTSLWKMFGFAQNFQRMFSKETSIPPVKNYIFFATGDVMLTSYFRVC